MLIIKLIIYIMFYVVTLNYLPILIMHFILFYNFILLFFYILFLFVFVTKATQVPAVACLYKYYTNQGYTISKLTIVTTSYTLYVSV